MGFVQHWPVKNACVEQFAAETDLELLEAILTWFRDQADAWIFECIAVNYRPDEHLYTGTVVCSARGA